MKKRTLMNGFYFLALLAGSFCFFSCEKKMEPTVATGDITHIGVRSFIANGSVENDGGSPILEKGFVYDTNNPDLESAAFSTEGAGEGDFTTHVKDGHSPKTIVKAYATNEVGTGYGEAKEITSMPSNPLEYNGYLYYVNSENESGLIQWSAGNDNGGLGTSLTDGAKNTEELAGDAEDQVSDLCHDLDEFGYDDWFLPAKEELEFIFENKDATGVGRWLDYEYWSSTQFDEDQAYAYDGVKNSSFVKDKVRWHFVVRCVRKEKL